MIDSLLGSESAEVLWDYCLERGIIAPIMPPMQYWLYGMRSFSRGIGGCSSSGRYGSYISYDGVMDTRTSRVDSSDFSISGCRRCHKTIGR